MSIIEKIYYKCPEFIQNIGIGLIGYKLSKERFNSVGDTFFKYLNCSENFTKKEVDTYQSDQFIKLARHAINNTPFYSDWAKKSGLSSGDIKSLDSLKLFPVIRKEDIRSNPELFRAQNIKKQFTLQTSGTTGTPLKIYTDECSRSKHYAFFSRLRQKYNINDEDKRCTLFGRVIIDATQSTPPFWRYDWYQKNLLMSSFHLSEQNVEYYYQKLVDFKPAEIFAYPSSILPIAKYIIKNKLPKLTLKLLITTAENLPLNQRVILENAFDTNIVNQYGCTEMSFFATENNGIMNVEPEHGIIEVLMDSGEVNMVGKGELVATSFINYSMPIIRYQVGDFLELGAQDCEGKQNILNLNGRTDDILYSMDDRPIARLGSVFKENLGVIYTQIIQNADKSLTVKVVPSERYSEKYKNDLISEIEKRFSSEIIIHIELVKTISKQPNGKFRQLISNYSPKTVLK
jgi:phenylacetate-CoA ligase